MIGLFYSVVANQRRPQYIYNLLQRQCPPWHTLGVAAMLLLTRSSVKQVHLLCSPLPCSGLYVELHQSTTDSATWSATPRPRYEQYLYCPTRMTYQRVRGSRRPIVQIMALLKSFISIVSRVYCIFVFFLTITKMQHELQPKIYRSEELFSVQ